MTTTKSSDNGDANGYNDDADDNSDNGNNGNANGYNDDVNDNSSSINDGISKAGFIFSDLMPSFVITDLTPVSNYLFQQRLSSTAEVPLHRNINLVWPDKKCV